jgi:hypothetical protein
VRAIIGEPFGETPRLFFVNRYSIGIQLEELQYGSAVHILFDGMNKTFSNGLERFPLRHAVDPFGVFIGFFGHAVIRAQVLKQCGDTLTRENVMKQAGNLKGFQNG